MRSNIVEYISILVVRKHIFLNHGLTVIRRSGQRVSQPKPLLHSAHGQIVHHIGHAFNAADISNAGAQRDIAFIGVTFQHADT